MESEVPASASIGAKSANGLPVTLCSGASTDTVSVAPTDNVTNLATGTTMYYLLNVSECETDENGNHYVYVAVQNTGDGIRLLTNVKFG